jgi:hypothetical protein
MTNSLPQNLFINRVVKSKILIIKSCPRGKTYFPYDQTLRNAKIVGFQVLEKLTNAQLPGVANATMDRPDLVLTTFTLVRKDRLLITDCPALPMTQANNGGQIITNPMRITPRQCFIFSQKDSSTKAFGLELFYID